MLLNSEEIDQIKLKVREHSWAATSLERVKTKADKDGAAVEACARLRPDRRDELCAQTRNRLMSEAREQMRHYEKLDVKAEPEWGRWSHWGATAWAYDLAYEAFTADERAEVERWLRTAAQAIIAQEKVLTTTPNLVFCEHWRVGMIGYCLGDQELIDWALRDPALTALHEVVSIRSWTR